MSEYKKKNEPQPQLDIGIWMDLLNLVSYLGVIVCVYLVIFTSEQLTIDAPYDDHTMYIIAFFVLHGIFIIKYLLDVAIPDVPAWIEEDALEQKHRV